MEKLMRFSWVCGLSLIWPMIAANASIDFNKNLPINFLRCKTEHGILLKLDGPASAKNPVLFSYLHLHRNFYLSTAYFNPETETLKMQLHSAQSMIILGVAETYEVILQGPMDKENVDEKWQMNGTIFKTAISFVNPLLPAWTSPSAKISCQLGMTEEEQELLTEEIDPDDFEAILY